MEAEWAEACAQPGPHVLIGQPDMRLFWQRCFGHAEEVAWDVFWSRFPKDLNRCTTLPSVSLYRVGQVPRGPHHTSQYGSLEGNCMEYLDPGRPPCTLTDLMVFIHGATCCREAGSGLVELFIPRANRETLQRALSRGNALMVTVVEVDFAFAAEASVSSTCRSILSAAAVWRSIGRLSSITSKSPTACPTLDNQMYPEPPQS